jgi:hypothetical protein
VSGRGLWVTLGSLHNQLMPCLRLLQFLLLFALTLAPFCGVGGRAVAMPAPTVAQSFQHTTETGHCADMSGQEDGSSDSGSNAECRMMNCADVQTPMPSLPEAFCTASAPGGMTVPVSASGLNPAAETPPPRLS